MRNDEPDDGLLSAPTHSIVVGFGRHGNMEQRVSMIGEAWKSVPEISVSNRPSSTNGAGQSCSAQQFLGTTDLHSTRSILAVRSGSDHCAVDLHNMPNRDPIIQLVQNRGRAPVLAESTPAWAGRNWTLL